MKVYLYDIYINLDFKTGEYSGEETIYMAGIDPWVDSEGIKIESVKVDGKDAEYELKDEGFKVKGFVTESLNIKFSGKASDTLMGFYRAKYGKETFYSTQFEPNGARTFIPCFDRPDIKARFKLTVKVNENVKVISNMPPSKVESQGSSVIYYFPETLPMSTYLLYLGVGNFDEIEDTRDGRKFFVAAYGGKSSRGKFALDVAEKVVNFYESYFNIKYPLPKLHLIAVPEFAVGAMENWGAITFREIALLADEKSSEAIRRNVATVIAHEIAHQWFGDLVTMKWWDDLWLNESFATFMSYKAIGNIFPEWEHWEDFIMSETEPAFLLDSLSNAHPIHVPVEKPEEIEQIFDDISYGKGASVLRMLEKFIGEDKFADGVRSYLRENSFSNATMEDLWKSLEKASGMPVQDIMNAWVTKSGHPLITVREKGEKFVLEQKKFNFLGLARETWPIPLTYYLNGKTVSTVFDKESIEVDKFLKANVEGSGFYRTLYHDWEIPLKASKSGYDRWNVLSDAYALLLAGLITPKQYFSVADKLMGDSSYLVALTLISQLNNLYLIAGRKVLENYVKHLNAMKESWEKRTDYKAKIFVGYLYRRISLVNDEFAKNLASQDYFGADPNIRPAVAIAKAVASAEPFDTLYEIYKKAQNDEDRVNTLNAMLNIRLKHDLLRALDLLRSEEVKKQDLRYITSAVTNVDNYETIWSWLLNNLDYIRKVFAKSGVLPRLFFAIIPYLGLEKRDEVVEYFNRNKIEEAEMGIKNGLELLEVHSKLRSSINASL